jgi:FMN phosphatase YigB (HAD superfamily)
VNPLVTFDFHNTLAISDDWFYLEIRDLPVKTLRHIDPSLLDGLDEADVTARYREMRKAVMASGREVDAIESVARMADAFAIRVERDAIAGAIDHQMRALLPGVEAVPGAIEAIRAIAAGGITVGVVSSAVYHPFLEWVLEHFGVAGALGFVITSASSGIYKSNPDIYRHAMAMGNAVPEHSIHIGDSPKWDVWSAQQAGMRAVWFSNGLVDTLVDRDFESHPDFTAETMDDVAPWVLAQLERAAR